MEIKNIVQAVTLSDLTKENYHRNLQPLTALLNFIANLSSLALNFYCFGSLLRVS